MNIAPPLIFIVPKSAQGWPLIASSAAGPCCVLSVLKADITWRSRPLAPRKDRSSAAPTAFSFAVLPPNEKAFCAIAKVRKTLLAS